MIRRTTATVVSALLGLTIALAAIAPPAAAETTSPSPAATPMGAVVIALDVSGSMVGANIRDARRAADQFVTDLPQGISVGMVTFSTRVSIVRRVGPDRDGVLRAIRALKATNGDTAMYDAVIAALALMPEAPVRRIVVLTDGSDTTSAASLQQTVTRASEGGIAIDIVAFRMKTKDKAGAREIALASGGGLLSADNLAGLQRALASAIDALMTPTPSPTPTSMLVQPVTGTDPVINPRTIGYASLLVLAVLALAVAGTAMQHDRRERRRRDRLIATYGSASRRQPIREAVAAQARRASGALSRVLRSSRWYRNAATLLDIAEWRLDVSRWLGIRVSVGLATAVVLTMPAGSFGFGLLIGAPVGYALSGTLLTRSVRRRRVSFEAGLADFLTVLAGALRAGLAFTAAIDSASSEGTGETGKQVRRAIQEVRLGSTIEDALLRVADRMTSPDLRWAVTALAIQREVGGNLSTIFETVAKTVRGRAELAREVRTLSAEGRLSAQVLIALPVGLFLFLLATNPGYIRIFWTEPVGYLMLMLIGGLMSTGWFWLTKISSIKV